MFNGAKTFWNISQILHHSKQVNNSFFSVMKTFSDNFRIETCWTETDLMLIATFWFLFTESVFVCLFVLGLTIVLSYHIDPDKKILWAQKCNYFLNHQFIHVFWVLKRTVSLRQWDGSFEYPQHMFWMRNKENRFPIHTFILRPVSNWLPLFYHTVPGQASPKQITSM